MTTNAQEHYKMQEDVYNRIAEVEREVTGLKTDVSYIRHAVDGLAAHSNKDTNWPGIITSIVGIATLMGLLLGGYSNMLISPIKVEQLHQREELNALESTTQNRLSELERMLWMMVGDQRSAVNDQGAGR